jgi:hypothetical protein
MTRLNGAYAVCVSSSISEDPVRWLFVDEVDADDFAAAINAGRKYPEAWVRFEPIALSLHDRDLRAAFPETVEAVLRRRKEESMASPVIVGPVCRN